MKRIYLDNAASTPTDPEVVDYMIPFLKDFYGNPSSVHDHGRKLRAIIEKSRKEIAELIGAAPAEIFFTSGGTEADNLAIKGTVVGMELKHIISSRIEHHAVTHPIEGFEKQGLDVTWLDIDKEGRPDLDQLDRELESKGKTLVCLMHANNELGTILDIQKAGEICAKHGAIFQSDTVQSMANVRYNLSELPVHFVTAAAHKFYGPKGVGFLYVKSGTQIPSLICGGSQERNMRAGTENVAAIAAMAFALKRCYANFESKNQHLRKLKYHMKSLLESKIPGVCFNGDTSESGSIPTVLNVAFPGEGNESMLLFNLDINGISASGGSACTSGSVKGSHVLNGIGCDANRAGHSIRFSFGVPNTIEEIEETVDKLCSFIQVPA